MSSISVGTAAALREAGLNPEYVAGVVGRAAEEDFGGDGVGRPGEGVDVTSVATVPFDAEGVADVVARQAGVVAGLPVAAATLELFGDDDVVVELRVRDGDRVAPGQCVLTVTGLTRTLLGAERTMLNLLCRLSGVASATRRWVDVLDGTGTVVRDTRKTTPGLRHLEKYAVRCGGGMNHRSGLHDAALVKDNHVLAAGGVSAAFAAVRATFPDVPVEVECDTVAQVREALDAGADLLLLDNMAPPLLREAVGLARGAGVRTEASGGLDLGTARDVAVTGVDFVAVGALTHSATVLDLGLDLRSAIPTAG